MTLTDIMLKERQMEEAQCGFQPENEPSLADGAIVKSYGEILICQWVLEGQGVLRENSQDHVPLSAFNPP